MGTRRFQKQNLCVLNCSILTTKNHVLIRNYQCKIVEGSYKCNIAKLNNVKYLDIITYENIKWNYRDNYVNSKIGQTILNSTIIYFIHS